MALALYRKYRPAKFAEVVGQEHVTEPLSTALAAGRINHAYLFSGPRGCGKTSSARILARSLNCELGPTAEPCGVCPSCVSLAPGGPGNIDVTELDAASHGGVDDTRELRDRAFFAPAESRYRVFIVDEAHMITTQGFNALLKIVEEPPEHLVFVFATTEPDKVLPTIRSRTHHYPFRLIPPGTLRKLMERICAEEGAVVAPAVYPLVIRAGGGSARDSLSVLDQLLAGAGPEGVTYERAVALLGVTDVSLIDDVVDALAAGDRAAVFEAVDRMVEAGHDPRRFASDLLQRLRDLTLLQAVPEAAPRGLVDAADDEIVRMVEQADRIGPATLARYGEIVHNGLIEMRGATAPRLLLELLCARMLLPAATTAEPGLLERLERLERRNDIAAAPLPGAETVAAPPASAAQRRTFERPSSRPGSSADGTTDRRSEGPDDDPTGPDSRSAVPPARAGESVPAQLPPVERPGAGSAELGDERDDTGSGVDVPQGGDRGADRESGPRSTGVVRDEAGSGQAPRGRASGANRFNEGAEGGRPREARGRDGSGLVESDRSTPSADRAGPDRAGADLAGPGQVGAGGAGPDRAGVDRAGADRAGRDRAGAGRAGLDQVGAGGAGPDRAGVDRAGADRAGAGRAGAGRAGPGQVGAGGAGPDRAGVDRAGVDRASADRAGADRAGADRAGADRAGADRAGADRAGADRAGADRAGADRAGADRVGDLDRPATDRPATDPTASRPGRTDQARAADQATPPRGAPPEPPPAAPASSNLDAAAIRRVWPEILAAAKDRKKRTAALLVSATVRAIEGDTLVLSIGTAPLARLLSEQSNTEVIAESLHAVLGVRWRVRCEHGEPGAPAPAPARGAAAAPPAPPAPPRRPSRPPPTRRSTAAADDGEPLPPEPPDEDTPPEDDEEAMLAEAAAAPRAAPADRRDPEEAAIELLTAQLGARAIDRS